MVADIPSSPILWSYPNQEDIPTFEFNPKKSRKLLKDAGFVYNKKSNYYFDFF